MVRVCRLCQNRCCCYLQSNRLCDKLCPTTIDGSVLSQISQLILSKDLILRYGIFLFRVCSSVWQSTRLLIELSMGSNPSTLTLFCYSAGNKSRKKWKIILLINKTEAFAMRKLVGNENVKQTYSGHSKYYLVESYNNLKALDKYRKSKIV